MPRPLPPETTLEAAAARWHEADEVAWRGDRLTARRVTRLGAIELAGMPVDSLPPGALATAWRRAVGAYVVWVTTPSRMFCRPTSTPLT